MVAMLQEKDVEEIRALANSKLEKHWFGALKKAFDSIMFAARALYKHKSEKGLDRALFQFSHQTSLLEDSLSYDRAIRALSALPGTEQYLDKVEMNGLSSYKEARPHLDSETAMIASEWEDCHLECQRLQPRSPEAYSAYRDRLFLDQWERSGGKPVSHELRRLLMVFALGHGFHSAPKSPILRMLMERYLEEVRFDLDVLTDMLGLGGECIAKVSVSELIEDPAGNEPLSKDVGKALLAKFKRS